jgi:hypothetical protein
MTNANTTWTETEIPSLDDIPDERPAFVPLEEGVYGFLVEEATPDATKKRDAMVKLKLQVTNKFGEAAGSLKRVVYAYITFNEGGLVTLKQFCRALDIAAPKNTRPDSIDDFITAILDAPSANAKLRIKEYKNKLNNEVDTYLTEEQAAAKASEVSGDAAPAEEAPRRRRRTEAKAAE